MVNYRDIWLYTWKDVEFLFFDNIKKWHDKWVNVDVYSSEVIIEVTQSFNDEDLYKSNEKLTDIFQRKFDQKNSLIYLDYLDQELNIIFEKTELPNSKKSYTPLFKDTNQEIKYPEDLKGVPVIAFHSYKGGVGRTLSLISTLKSLSQQNNNTNQSGKILLVDSDIEAPGLSWLAQEENAIPDIGLLDAYSLIHNEEKWRDRALDFIASKIKETVLRFPVGNKEFEHYFLPAFRSENQAMEIPIHPENIINISNREWIIGDFLSELGSKLNVDAVLIDLRAGISEYSAPILFDPRIRKVFVTSTSLQSVKGTELILKRIFANINLNKYPAPSILVSMVPNELINTSTITKIQETLLSVFPDITDEVNEDYSKNENNIILLPFASQLVHIENFNTIEKKLSGTEMEKEINLLTRNWTNNMNDTIYNNINDSKKVQFLKRLKEKAKEMEYAEKKLFTAYLKTTSMKNIARKFKVKLPYTVIMGAKGSGKTFAYLQLVRLGTWNKFVSEVEGQADTPETMIVPFLKPRAIEEEAVDALNEHCEILSEKLGFNWNVSKMDQLKDRIQVEGEKFTTEAHWKEFWKELILEITDSDIGSIDQLNEYLEKLNKKIVIAIDGLEEAFPKTSRSENQQLAIQALCQGLIDEFRFHKKNRIGLVIFLRTDVGKNSIVQNWGHFKSMYQPFELNWSNTEALRLVSWIVGSIDSHFIDDSLPIEETTRDLLEHKLRLLWGIKLGTANGNEAYSANWILAALSDLNEQLQPRDIVRFLKFASEYSLNSKYDYNDRYLTPSAIRNAIEPCSVGKIDEIGQEMEPMKKIFEKLNLVDREKKQVPFQVADTSLSTTEIQVMESQGYLVELNDGYYMPEIIRRGLKFGLAKGARPKVLALLRKRQQKN